MQAVYLRVLKHMKQLGSEEALWNWLARAARNAHTDGFRTGGRYRNALSRFAEWIRDLGGSGEIKENEEQTLLKVMDEVVAGLPDELKGLLEERYHEGHSIRAMAEKRKMSERAMEGRLSRLRARIRTEMEAGMNQTRRETNS